MIVRFFSFPNGSVSRSEYIGDPDLFSPPDGGVEITEAEYGTLAAAVEAANAQLVAELQEEADAARLAAYLDFRAAGIGHAAAALATGYTGPPVDPPMPVSARTRKG